MKAVKRISAFLMAMLCGLTFLGCSQNMFPTVNSDNQSSSSSSIKDSTVSNDNLENERVQYSEVGYLQATVVKQASGKTNAETGEKEQAELVNTKVVNNIRFLQYKIGEIQNCFIQTVTEPIFNDENGGLESLSYKRGTLTARSLSNGLGKSISESESIQVAEGTSTKLTWDIGANANASVEGKIAAEFGFLSADVTASRTFDLAASYNYMEESYSSQEIAQGVVESSYEDMDLTSMEQSYEEMQYTFDMTKYETGYYYALSLVADVDVYQIVAYDILTLEFYTSYFATSISSKNTGLRMLASPTVSFGITGDYQLYPIEGISVDKKENEVERSYAVTLNADGGSDGGVRYVKNMDTLTLPKSKKDGFYFTGWFDENGEKMPETIKPVKDITLTARWEKLLDAQEIAFDRQNCKVDNGYNPAQVGSATAEKTHSTFELIYLVVGNCIELGENTYGITDNDSLKLSFKMWEPNQAAGPSLGWANWYTHTINKDNYSNPIYGTNISGETVEKGAYYVKVTYTSGETTEINATNVFEGVSKGTVVSIKPNELKEGRLIDTIEIVFVYELFYEYYNGWWSNGYSNWRCSKTLKFIY
ncbi:MAG: hypothetical protein E7377_04200 [Clostridiales bacterium]|nr:hypothetical protein [Clostridiales bacterium]